MANEKKNDERKITLSRNNIKRDLRLAEIYRDEGNPDWIFGLGLMMLLVSCLCLPAVREEYPIIEVLLWVTFGVSSVITAWSLLFILRTVVRLIAINAGKFKIEILPLDHVEMRTVFEPYSIHNSVSLHKSVWYFCFPSMRWRPVVYYRYYRCHYEWSYMKMDTKTLVDRSSSGELYYVAVLNCDKKHGKIGYVYSTEIFEYQEKI